MDKDIVNIINTLTTILGLPPTEFTYFLHLCQIKNLKNVLDWLLDSHAVDFSQDKRLIRINAYFQFINRYYANEYILNEFRASELTRMYIAIKEELMSIREEFMPYTETLLNKTPQNDVF